VFTLATPATGAPTAVRVDGVVTTDSTFDVPTNTITVNGTIAGGASIEVDYPVAATCGG
jgi:hypothetical protein